MKIKFLGKKSWFTTVVTSDRIILKKNGTVRWLIKFVTADKNYLELYSPLMVGWHLEKRVLRNKKGKQELFDFIKSKEDTVGKAED